MSVVADENVDQQIIERLRADGHRVQSVAEFEPGIDDHAVLFKSHDANAILLTADKAFGELVFRQGLVHSGVLLIRLAGIPPGRKAELISWALRNIPKNSIAAWPVVCRCHTRSLCVGLRRERTSSRRYV